VLGDLTIGPFFCFAALCTAMQAEEHGQRPALVEESDFDGEHDPDMTPVEEQAPSDRQQRVAMHRCGSDALTGVSTEGVVDNQSHVAGGRHVFHDEISQHESNGVRRPPAREKNR